MGDIRAFVGHSFSEEDADTVGKFLKYFDQLTKLLPNFSWQNAEAAEPRALTEKVLQLIHDKNLFIGICTRRERVAAPAALTPTFLGGALKVKAEHLEWKTSDWIIQEVGLAIGRDMSLILLIEDGVRKLNGLHSDVEYIPFSRSVPDRSFGKILEMLSALSPKAHSTTSGSLVEAAPVATQEQKEIAPPVSDEWRVPKPDWKKTNYEFAYMVMALEDESVAMATIDKTFRDSAMALEGDSLPEWSAFTEYYRLISGKSGSLSALKELAAKHPDNSKVLTFLADGYVHYQDHQNAATLLETAASKAPNGDSKLDLLGRAAVQFTKASKRKSSARLLRTMKDQVAKSGVGERVLLKTIREVSEFAKDDTFALAAMERLTALDPDDTDNRFSLAFKHSEHGNNDLALMHYIAIPHDDRSSTTWNNMGVAYEQGEMHGESVTAYRMAAEAGETLAMSNLANKFMSVGFLSEAEQECNRALSTKKYHKNIATSLAKLKGLSEKEEQSKGELLDSARTKSAFFQRFGHAASLNSPTAFPAKWRGPECILNVHVTKDEFVAEGSYERKLSGLLAISSIWTQDTPDGGSESAAIRYTIRYAGRILGKAIEAQVTKRKEGEPPPSLLGSADDRSRVMMILSEDENSIAVMEFSSGNEPRRYTLKRQT